MVLEAETAGFGASGRNGGWCSALFPSSLATLAAASTREAALAQYDAMRDSVDEVVAVAATEGIEADIVKGGTVVVARGRAQQTRAEAEVAEARRWGRDDPVLLGAEDARARLAATGTLAATYTPHCAVVHPAKLARGLAHTVEQRGVRIHEQTRVRAIEPGRAVTGDGTVIADVVVRATEGYTAELAGLRRAVVPVHSLVIATEPLPDSVWREIGLSERETFADHRHLIVYGQRTAEGRMVFGGRGAPYRFGSRIAAGHHEHHRTFRHLYAAMVELFPVLRGTHVTHAWGGALGVTRDWSASVGLEDGVAWAGGYVGDGVSTANLAGRTLRDLILGRPSELTRLPWVGHRSPAWEPEPLRWLGVNAGRQGIALADVEERLTGRPSLVARLIDPLLG